MRQYAIRRMTGLDKSDALAPQFLVQTPQGWNENMRKCFLEKLTSYIDPDGQLEIRVTVRESPQQEGLLAFLKKFCKSKRRLTLPLVSFAN